MSTEQPLPSPEEIQRKLGEFMKKEFGDRVVFAAPKAEAVETGPTGEETKHRPYEFAFDFKPKELEYLRVEAWTEETLLQESALFCLIAALRKIIESGLMKAALAEPLWSEADELVAIITSSRKSAARSIVSIPDRAAGTRSKLANQKSKI